MKRNFMCTNRNNSLLIAVMLSFLFLMSGCSSSLPNLHSEEFSSFYDNGEKLAGNSKDNEWHQSNGVPTELKENQFGHMIVRSLLPVLVEFHVSWCGYCENFKPTFREIAKEYVGKVRFASINAEENKILASKMGVRVYPTFFLIKDGTVLDEWRGIEDKSKFKKRLNSLLDLE